MEIKPKSFVLYTDLEETLKGMSNNDVGILTKMIFAYVNRGNIDEFLKIPIRVSVLFPIIRAQLDRDREKYAKKCQKNSENGKLGGRPKANFETQKNRSVFEKSYNDNKNKNKNNNNSDNNSATDNDSDNVFLPQRSFDLDDFFNAAVKRSYEE